MRQIFVTFTIGMPLILAAVFIVNSVASNSFPMFREIPFDESQILQQSYQAGLDHCENNYGDFDTLDKKKEYEECISLVETWYSENIENDV